MYTQNEKILMVPIEEDMQNSYIDYAMSVIIGRALPDVRDGLKPVHRRILYAMNEMGLAPNKSFKKSARIVGEVLGKYHPHGDSAVYDSMVRMAQSFSLRYPLVNGQGNFGSVDGDSAAAMRYTEVKLQKIARELMEDIQKDTVDFIPNYDESLTEPTILPTRVPQLLLNGSSGIAVGMATNIPPHNLTELVDGTKHLIDNPDCEIADLMQFVKGPDFPTGGIIMGTGDIRQAYETGRGSVRIRGRAGIEPARLGKECIIISEIPYQLNKTKLIEKIVHLIQDKVITGISDLRDESDKDGMRIVVELKRGEIPKVVLNQLYKHTSLETTFGVNTLAISNGKPMVMNLKEVLEHFVTFRIEVVTRRTKFELDKALARAHILEGLKIALANIDDVVAIIRKSGNRDEAKRQLITKFGLSELQAAAILEMRLYQLTSLEQGKIEEEYKQLQTEIKRLRRILEDEQVMRDLIKGELDDVKAAHSDERRTEIIPGEKDLKIEDLIANERCVITISRDGYIKRVPVNTYRQQHRGGKGITGMETKEEDFVQHLFIAATHDYMLFFTSKGRVYWLKVYEIPQASRISKGKAIVNLLNLTSEEHIAAMISTRTFNEFKYLVMATRKGIVKKSELAAYSNPRKTGIIGINIDDDDELIEVMRTTGTDDVILVTFNGQSIRFHEDQVRETGRATRGVKGIALEGDDKLVSMVVTNDENETLLVVCENGFGKRTFISQYRVQNRGGKGIITIKATARNGKVVEALKVTDDNDLMMTTASGKMVRIPVKGISVIGRNTQGVTMISFKAKNDKLVGVCKVIKEEEAADNLEEEENGATVPVISADDTENDITDASSDGDDFEDNESEGDADGK